MKSEKNVFDIVIQKASESQTKVNFLMLNEHRLESVLIVSYCDNAILCEFENNNCVVINRSHILALEESKNEN